VSVKALKYIHVGVLFKWEESIESAFATKLVSPKTDLFSKVNSSLFSIFPKTGER